MRIRASRTPFGVLAFVLFLAACGGNSGSAVAPHTSANVPGSGVLPPAFSGSLTTATHNVVYLSDIDGRPGKGQILAYPASLDAKNPPLARTILRGAIRPIGLWVDSAGTLYAANIPNGFPTNGVEEYQPGATTPFRELKEDLAAPTAVAVAADGTVYVNDGGVGCSTDVCVVIFPAGSVHASAKIPVPITGYAHGAGQLAFDKRGNVLVAASTFRTGLEIFKLNPVTHDVSKLDVNVGTGFADGIATDAAGNLYVTTNGGGIAVFPPGAKHPARTTTRGGTAIWAMPDGTLYVATGGGVDEYKPGANAPFNTITATPPMQGFGVAVGPDR